MTPVYCIQQKARTFIPFFPIYGPTYQLWIFCQTEGGQEKDENERWNIYKIYRKCLTPCFEDFELVFHKQFYDIVDNVESYFWCLK